MSFSKEIVSLKSGKPITRTSKVPRLVPFLVHLETVGGRLKQSLELYLEKKNLILIPNQQYIANSLVFHFHEIIFYQGRHLTAEAIGVAWYWITGCTRLVYSNLYECVKCRRLCGSFASQKMADLKRNDQLLVHHLPMLVSTVSDLGMLSRIEHLLFCEL